MSFDLNLSKTNLPKYFLITSLIPFAIKGIDYALLGSFIPLLIALLLISALILTYNKWQSQFPKVVKAWGAMICFWVLMRFSIMILFMTTSVQEAHIDNQFNILYVSLSTIYLVAGIYFFRKKPF